MIPQAKVDAIRRLLATGGLSQRDVAKLLDVSRGTVGAVAAGKRRDPIYLPTNDETPDTPAVRCPGCGGKVYAPCILCRVRRLKAAERADRRRTAGRDDALTRRRSDPTRSC